MPIKSTIFVLLLFSVISTLTGQVILSEDFQQGIPNTWTLIDNDGLTPHPQVAQFTAAWIGFEGFNAMGDTVAMSTSWYSPVGTADDWLITPQINLTSDNVLSWEAGAPDPNFRDGYEVRISTTTPTIAGFNANPALFTIAAEASIPGFILTPHSVNLQTAGYSNQPVYLAWRNNSNDKFILVVDNIKVEKPTTYNAALTEIIPLAEYTQIPAGLMKNILALAGVVKNIGSSTITGIELNVEVRDGSMSLVHSEMSAAPSLAPGESDTLDLVGYAPMTADSFWISYFVEISETDTDPSNDTIHETSFVTDSVYARDNSMVSGALGIGTAGELGQLFTLTKPALLTSVSAFIVNGTGNMTSQPLSANIYAVENGFPTTFLASTDTISVDTSKNKLWNLKLANGGLLLPADSFAIVVEERDSNVSLGTSTEIFKPATTYINFPGNPFSGWAHNEDYAPQFAVSYVLRANFNPCMDSLLLAQTIPGSADGLSFVAGSNITSTDTIQSGAMNIDYNSGGTVDLIPGFMVESGVTWQTLMEGCPELLMMSKAKDRVILIRSERTRLRSNLEFGQNQSFKGMMNSSLKE